MIKQSVLLGLVFFGSSAYPYVTGYNHLYNPHTNTVVDILYDAHVEQEWLSAEDMENLSFHRIKPQLFKTEQRLLDAFEVMNRQGEGLVDIIWEHGLNLCGDSAFIGYPEELVERQFRNINLVPSDICRDAFEELLCEKRRRNIEKTLAGVSFVNPMPVSDEDLAMILSTYGDRTFQEFERLRSETANRLVDRFVSRYLKGTKFRRKDFKKDDFDVLADCEIISNILSSRKPHVIVYCGGWHSEEIYYFLTDYAGFKPVGKQIKDRDGEINPKDLAPLDKEYRTGSWQPAQTGRSS